MSLAVEAILSGELSYKEAARRFNIDKAYIYPNVSYVRKRNTMADLPVFSLDEESVLNEYISECSRMHYGLTKLQVGRLAYEYATSLDCCYPPKWDKTARASPKWVWSFHRRHCNFILKKCERPRTAHLTVINRVGYDQFLEDLQTLYEQFKFTADRIFNFDECGISNDLDILDLGNNSMKNKRTDQLVPVITFGAIISANGNLIPPLFVFPRVDHFIRDVPERSLAVVNESGGVSSKIFLVILKHIQKHTLCSKENPILLLCNSRESHISLEVIKYALGRGIIYQSFPPNTSHYIQPLNAVAFGPFKSKLKTELDNWKVTNPGKTVSIGNIPKMVKLAYVESYRTETIANAFSSTGIWPLKAVKIDDSVSTQSNVLEDCSDS